LKEFVLPSGTAAIINKLLDKKVHGTKVISNFEKAGSPEAKPKRENSSRSSYFSPILPRIECDSPFYGRESGYGNGVEEQEDIKSNFMRKKN
jgi:hypothetical protein